MLGETGLQSVEDLRCVAGFEAMVLHDDMSGQTWEEPDVTVQA